MAKILAVKVAFVSGTRHMSYQWLVVRSCTFDTFSWHKCPDLRYSRVGRYCRPVLAVICDMTARLGLVTVDTARFKSPPPKCSPVEATSSRNDGFPEFFVDIDQCQSPTHRVICDHPPMYSLIKRTDLLNVSGEFLVLDLQI